MAVSICGQFTVTAWRKWLKVADAAILNLEPLSFEAALAYIGSDGTGEDERRVAWIVETADVVEADFTWHHAIRPTGAPRSAPRPLGR